jgi:hypothetical protein
MRGENPGTKKAAFIEKAAFSTNRQRSGNPAVRQPLKLRRTRGFASSGCPDFAFSERQFIRNVNK